MKRTAIKRKPQCLRSRSPAKAADDARYLVVKAAHFREHPACQMPGCTRSLLKGDIIDLHHKAGRSGPLLYHRPHFASLCRRHHDQVHECVKESRANGWIIDLRRDEVYRIRQAELIG